MIGQYKYKEQVYPNSVNVSPNQVYNFNKLRVTHSMFV